jgi:hypothetical protein
MGRMGRILGRKQRPKKGTAAQKCFATGIFYVSS